MREISTKGLTDARGKLREEIPRTDNELVHRSDSIQGTDYTANDYIVILLEFKGFKDKNWKSKKKTNQKKHLSCNRQKFVKSFFQKLKILVVYKNCKSRY